MKLKFLAITLLLLTHPDRNVLAENNNDSFTVYCTGNHDSTGICMDTSQSDGNNSLKCIMVPGNIIDCKNDSEDQIECILITATSAQSEFSCRKIRSNSINQKTVNFIDNASVEVDSVQNDLSENEGGPNIEVKTDVFSNPFR